MYLKNLGVVCLILFSGIVFGQDKKVDTTYAMKEVVIMSTRLQEYAVGSNIQRIKSKTLKSFSSQSFAELLASKSLVLINSYGPGGLSNPSIRGGGASHTAVIWNGVNIQSPMNGGVNLALFPVGFLEKVNIQYGGTGTLFGSGAVSGIIHIGEGNLFRLEDQLNLNVSYGSYDTKAISFGLKLGNENIAFSLKYFLIKSDNDFKFKRNDGSVFTQSNAELNQNALMGKVFVKTGNNSSLILNAWYQKQDKNIQTLLNASSPSAASQESQNIRTAIKWNYISKAFVFKFRSVYLNEKVKYLDPSYMSDPNKNIGRSLINEVEARYLFDENHSIIGGFNYTLEEAESGDYTEDANRKRFSIFLSHKMQNLFGRMSIVNSVRQEVVDKVYNPIVFSSGLDLNLSSTVDFIFNISRTYNNPGLNDLYWAQGPWSSGNPNLKPEYGWSGDLGLKEQFKIHQASFELKQNFFWNNINDWIVWLPNQDYIWMPDNKKVGRTKGVEIHLNSNFLLNRAKLNVQALYTYTDSKFEEMEDEISVQKQSIYVPQNQWVLSANYQQKYWGIDLTQNYFGERFYDVNQDPFKAYMIFDLAINYKIPVKNHEIALSFKVQNLGNKSYQMINNYAMPGRNFRISLFYNLYLRK